MKTKQNTPLALLSLLLAGGMALTSCTDSNYDLGNIDGTVAFGSDQGITLPGNNSTTEMKLSDLIDIDESDCITTLDNGDYVFYKIGNDVEPARPYIERIRITRHSSADIPQKVGPETEPADLPSLPVGATINGTAGSIEKEINIFDYRGDKPEAVVDLHEVDIEGTVKLSLSFNGNLQAFLPYFTSLDVVFPEYMSLKSVSRGTVKGNRIELRNIPTSEKLDLTAEVASLSFRKGDAENVIMIDGDQVVIKGQVKLVATYPDLTKGVGDITDMLINGVTHISDIDIVSATGRFNPSIDLDDFGDIEITNVPGILTDPAVDMSIHDPQLTLSINSNMDVDGLVDGTLTAYFRNGGQKTVAVNGIEVPRNTQSKILICRRPKELPYEDYTQVKVISDLSELFRTIPERITFKARAQADQDKVSTFLLGHDGYQISTAYRFETKMALDAGSVIVYNDTIDGWGKDLRNKDFSRDTKITVTFDASSHVPANIDLEIIPIRAGGTDLNTAQKTLLEVKSPTTIKPGDSKGMVIEILQKEEKSLKQLDGLRIRAIITSTEAIPLNKRSQTIKLENITATLVGRVVIEDDKD